MTLVHDLEQYIIDNANRDIELTSKAQMLLVAIEAGNTDAIGEAEALMSMVYGSLPKILAPVPSEIKVSISGAFHNKETNQAWLESPEPAGFKRPSPLICRKC
jgi:hypothetical protein